MGRLRWISKSATNTNWETGNECLVGKPGSHSCALRSTEGNRGSWLQPISTALRSSAAVKTAGWRERIVMNLSVRDRGGDSAARKTREHTPALQRIQGES